MISEYRTISEISGPLVAVRNVDGAAAGETAEIELENGEIRRCLVLVADSDAVLLQLLDNTAGLSPATSRVRFHGRPLKLALSEDIIGRVFSGFGKPVDHGPDILAYSYSNINGGVPALMERPGPGELIETGISAIDCVAPLVLGQVTPVFSGAGLPHAQLVTQIVRQSSPPGADAGDFTIVFAGIGITFDESEFYSAEFDSIGVLDRSVVFMNHADDPVLSRIVTPAVAMTAAEYLAFEKDMHVLVILTDMTNYADALREVSAARKEPASALGYPGSLHSDFSAIFSRAGGRSGKRGSITVIPVFTVPGDDISHPVPETAAYSAQGRITLSRSLFLAGVIPPVDALASLSSRGSNTPGDSKTAESLADTGNQLISAYSRGKAASASIARLGKGALSEEDVIYAEFSVAFEKRFIMQGKEYRTASDTLAIAWDLLQTLPKTDLKRIKLSDLNENYVSKK